MAVENDRSERILPAALAGTWISDKGSSITFGPSHKVSADLAGATRHGRYRLEAYKLVIDGRSLGWISLEERDRFLLFTSREQSERFHRVQA
ncbi:MAG: hypothetical protein QOJ65_1390 [Fimbriimonadaceae bacterium]|jgi:hypothetical protein|nr:hypothetical protein [Fimbriimonadaceae bacterium]